MTRLKSTIVGNVNIFTVLKRATMCVLSPVVGLQIKETSVTPRTGWMRSILALSYFIYVVVVVGFYYETSCLFYLYLCYLKAFDSLLFVCDYFILSLKKKNKNCLFFVSLLTFALGIIMFLSSFKMTSDALDMPSPYAQTVLFVSSLMSHYRISLVEI